ncbi:IST1 homolog isoform X2 [Cylas formicarius]|uniref:IST1 homolog isoform X2 n=1 Tax=Cylas formicarius TaxID=197179 RepID=UPI0029584217|nr:IST1 homolog isoform X2 [Cylas formicarius]
MFSSSPNYTKLKTNLRLAMTRLKLLEKKKSELTEKTRREIAEFLTAGKVERARIRVEYIIREDYLVEALEIVEMYCDLLVARFGLISNMKELDEGIAEAVSSLIWVAPRLQSDIQELKIIADLLSAKYGPSYAEACRIESVESISPKLKHKMAIQAPPKILVEKYLIEIAKCFNIPYEPDLEVMATEKDGKNNLGGSGMPQPPGFVGYPQPPALPTLMDPPIPFAYPPPLNPSGKNDGASAPPASFSYNIPPGGERKESNTDYLDNNLPTYSMVFPDVKKDPSGENAAHDDNLEDMYGGESPRENNLENSDRPKPQPRSKINNYNFDLPDLPSVPSHSADPPASNSQDRDDDIDFDDLTKRFNELKKKY